MHLRNLHDKKRLKKSSTNSKQQKYANHFLTRKMEQENKCNIIITSYGQERSTDGSKLQFKLKLSPRNAPVPSSTFYFLLDPEKPNNMLSYKDDWMAKCNGYIALDSVKANIECSLDVNLEDRSMFDPAIHILCYIIPGNGTLEEAKEQGTCITFTDVVQYGLY